MSYTLVVIDMQRHFDASNKLSVQKDIAKQIKKAIKERAGIIFVEYAGCGLTHSVLTDLAENYERGYTIKKYNDDGSAEVLDCLTDNKLPKSRIKICGVNTPYCVKSTAIGLSEELPKSKLQIISKSCNSDSSSGHRYGLSLLRKIQNISIN